MNKRSASYAERIDDAKLLSTGISQNLAELSNVGINDSFISELENQRKTVESLNADQEKGKAELKTKSDQLRKEMAKLTRLVSRGRKLVKIELDSSRWKEYGIEDKH